MCYNEDGDDMEKYNPVYVITVMVCICIFSFLTGYFSNKKDTDKKDKQDTVEKDTNNNEENKEK